MTRYAEAAAALGCWLEAMLLANDSPNEQFSLTPGGRYYFDLSAMNIPGTANGSLPDNTCTMCLLLTPGRWKPTSSRLR